MKTLFLLSITAFLYANSDLQWVDEQIEAIKPERTGVSHSYIHLLKDPMSLKKSQTLADTSKVQVSKDGKSVRKLHLRPLVVEAIINDSAYINGNWYQLNDKVRGQKLSYINDAYVILDGKKKKTRLFVNKNNNKIKITTR